MNHFRSKRLLALLCLSILYNSSFAQQKISGVIVSEGNSPLAGATISLKKSAISTITTNDGNFAIVAKKGDILEVSFTGYKTGEIKVANETNIKVILQPTMLSPDEVVVTGYTSQRVKDITGSVAAVKSKDPCAVPGGQVEQVLKGRVTGLNIITSGEPGGPTTIRLHGTGDYRDFTPLYIINGTPCNINALNPFDIESLQILKDAAPCSISGVRGSNGVIIITTKWGKPGKTQINYKGYEGWQQPLKKGSDLLSPRVNAEMIWYYFPPFEIEL